MVRDNHTDHAPATAVLVDQPPSVFEEVHYEGRVCRSKGEPCDEDENPTARSGALDGMNVSERERERARERLCETLCG